MFTKISSLTLAILLFLVLMGSRNNPYVLVISTLVLIFASFALNFKRLNFTWPHLVLPTTYILAVTSVFIIISQPTFRTVFLVAASVVFYFLEMKLGRESHFLQNSFLFTVFGLYLGTFAVQYYYHIPGPWIMPVIFIESYLFSVQGFAGFTLPAKKYFNMLIALITMQAALGLTLWPTHFFVNTVVLFCLFYIIWIFAFSAFFGKLSRQKVYWQASLVALVLILTLTTAAWRPL